MREGWSLRAIKKICEIRPQRKEVRNFLKDHDVVSFIPMSSLGIGQKYVQSNEAKELQDVYSGYTYFADGDVLLAKITPCFENGKLAIAKGMKNGIGFGSSEFFVIRCSELISNEYLYYFLSQDSFITKGVSSMTGTSGHQRVSKTFIENYRLPLPPLPEQKRIVAILDEAFEAIDTAIANTQKNIQNAQELFDSELNRVFTEKGEGWEEKKFNEVIKLKSGDGLTKKQMMEGAYPVYGGNGISGYHNQHNLKSENVIVGRVGALCGNVRCLNEEIWLTDNAFRVLNYEKIFDGVFLTYLLNSKNLRSYARQAAQPVISNSSLKDVVLTYPISLIEQRKIVKNLEYLKTQKMRSVSLYEQKLTSLSELRQSILQKAFTGELTGGMADEELKGAGV